MKSIQNNLNEKPFSKIYRELLKLGINMNYMGFWFCAYAVYLIAENPARITHIVKSVYVPVSEYFRVSAASVERNIRTVIETLWNENPAGLRKYAGYNLQFRPTCSQFISIIAAHVISDSLVL